MAGMTVSGLVSGLDVSAIVGQLISSESAPQTRLRTQLSAAQTDASSYRSVNTKLTALLSAAQSMTDPTSWAATSATASTSSVGVSSTGAALPGQLTFQVTQTAAAHAVITHKTTPWTSTGDSYGLTSPIEVFDEKGVSAGSIPVGGTGTLGDAITAINASSFGLQAAAVMVAPGQYQLQVTSAATGAANVFSLGGSGEFATVTQGADATLKVGTGAGAYQVTSPTNTFTGLMPGVTLTVTQPEATVNVTIASDPDAVATSMQKLVDAANATLADIDRLTDSTSSSAPLIGDSTLRGISAQLARAISGAVGALGSPAQVGVQLNKDGTIKFDKSAFVAELTAHPDLAKQFVSGTTAAPGLADRLATLATAATDSVSGTLTSLAKGQDSRVKGLQSQIDDWTVRLTARQEALTRQYSTLQSALSTLQSQQSWLSSQLDSLSTWKSSSN